MANDAAFQEEVLKKLRGKLRSENIKLWDPPYNVSSDVLHPCHEELQKLAVRFSEELGFSIDTVVAGLEYLQSHALQNLASKTRFQETGLATLQVKFSGPGSEQKQIVQIEISINATGQDLKVCVSQKIDVVPDRLKLICSGRIVNEADTLQQQNVKHNSRVMAMLLAEDNASIQEIENRRRLLEDTKANAHHLAGRSWDHDEFGLHVADQSGQTLKLPMVEKRALAVALTLHEKGRAAMKKKDFVLALVFFLEADSEFSQCQSKLLESVDNYALLNLDIAWCYLCLQSVDELPAADRRLQVCEESFQRSYGKNMERLWELKGGNENELALYVRLHLLQAIVAYHQNRWAEAKSLVLKAEDEMNVLKVDDTRMAELISLGYNEQESRQALRATRGSLLDAQRFIERKKQEHRDILAKEQEARARNKLQRRLGKCINGNNINVDLYRQMKEMGFPSGLAWEALRRTNNNLHESLQHLQDHPELFYAPDPEARRPEITDSMIQQLCQEHGFAAETASAALRRHHGNSHKAVEELLANFGVLPESLPASSSASTSSFDADEGDNPAEDHSRTVKAYECLAEDIPDSYTDHLDIVLDTEEKFLEQYKTLIFLK